ATNPSGVTDTTPEFRARFQDPDSGNTGVHYQIQVNTNSSFTGTVMWDSTKTSMTSIAINSFSPEISYAGSTLTLNSTTYYWRIKFWDNAGAEGPWSATANFTMNGTPTAPTVLLTEGATNPTGVTDTTPEFSAIFNDPNVGNTGAYYEINVNTNSSFTGTVMWNSGQIAMSSTAIGARSTDISYAGTPLTLNGTTYYWRIRFTDNHGSIGAWSTGTNSFRMNSAPTAPTSLQVEGATNPVIYADPTPEFTAIFNDPNTGDTANYYEIHVNTSSAFNGTAMWHSGQAAMTPLAIGQRSPELSYAGSTLTAGTYYWRIRFTDNNGTIGAWSATANFTINTLPTQPTVLQTEGLINPTGVTDITPEFSAIFNDPDSDSALHYEIEVNSNSSFTGTVMWDSTQTAISAISNGTRSSQISYAGSPLALNGSIYYWRIRFWDSYGLVSPWSEVANFRMNTQPSLPSALQTDGSVNPVGVSNVLPKFTALFSDPDGDSSTHYEVEVNTNSSFTGTVMWDSGQVVFPSAIASGSRTSEITYDGLALVNNGSTYYWRVRLWDSNGTASEWSLVNSFKMNSLPNTPSVLQTNEQANPEQVATLNPLFTALFNDPDGDSSTHYEVEVNTNSSFSGTVMWDSGQVAFPLAINSGARTSDITYSGTPLVTNGTTYYWRMRLWDSKGAASGWSSVNSFKMLDVPNPVSDLSGEALSTTSIRWSFVDNSNGESGIRLYDQGDTLVKTCVGENLPFCDEDGLDENTQYTRYAIVYNDEAQSPASQSAQRYTLLSVPTVSYLGKSHSTVTISSTTPTNGGELYFDCEGDCDSNINQWTTQNIATIENLENNTSYTFKVRGRNGDSIETAYSSGISVYTHSGIPILSLGPLSTTSISLSASGINNLSTGDSGIFFECIDSNCDTGIRDWLKSTTDVAIDLEPNTQYSFRAKARNFDGQESPYSSTLSSFTLATIPTLTNVNAVSSSTISLRVLNGLNPSNTEISIQETLTGKYVNISTGELEINPYWGINSGEVINITDLNPSTTYTFKVKARNGNDIETEYSGTSSATTLLATISAISPTVDSSSQITWRIAGDTSDILGIKLYSEEGELIKTCLGSDIYSCSEGSLLPNITYTRKMKIYNNLSESEFTNVVSATTYANIPSLNSIVAGQYSDESVNIKVDINGNSNTTRYAIQEVTTGKYFNPNTQLLQSEISLSTFTQLGSTQGSTVYGLTPNTEYKFRVKAFNDSSTETAYSDQKSLITLASNPSIVSVNAISNSSLKILLSNGNNNPSTLFKILETKSNTGINTSSKVLDNQTVWKTYSEFGANNGIIVGNLQPNTQYSFCALAKNTQNLETKCSQSVSAYTHANTPSITLRAIGASSSEIVINKNSNPTNTRYQIVESDTNGSVDNENKLTTATVLHDNARVSSNFLLTNLPPDTTYSFKVRSVNSDGLFSPWSESLSVTTWANPPKDLTFETIGGSTGRVKFNRNGNPNSTRYAIQESNSGKYLDYSTLQLVNGVVWGTYSSWGSNAGLQIKSLDPGLTYSFRAKAINSANVETSFVESNTGKTYSIIINKP
ncbi:MAG: fibronectin type III domain-containing protein, partial [Candidatus Dojkabacteria bacterium]|nr:fibronectin type III domain-containing protein [Candidatus Dojkabacteria bacterium]